MENKYFTPDIEDIHIGYELEVNYNFKLNDIFHKKIIDSFEELSDIYARMPGDCVIRIPYLTKEQIEGEGFVYRGKISTGTIPGEPFTKIELEFIKNNILIRFDIISNKVMIDKADSTEENVNFYNVKTLYHGECKDINTFRKIIKLLNI
jgi:hypothetical protein